jgi:outer membrane receptor for ferrienterochelin and colicin
LSGYYNQCRKFIEYIPEEHVHRNIASDADVYGGEIEAKVAIRKNVRLFGNFSYLRGVEKAKVILASHVHPDEANPNYKVAGGLEWMGLEGFFGAIVVSYVDGYKMALTDPNNTKVILFPVLKIVSVDPYTLLTAKIGYKFYKDTFEVGVYGQNLLFKKYNEFPGLPWNRDTNGDGIVDDHEVYGGEELGTKLYGFVGVKF